MAVKDASTKSIHVHHLTRVEGHGNIRVDILDGVIQRCEMEIVEAPRYFEAMLRGLNYQQAPQLASRICGICAVSHNTASILAVERALDVNPSEQTRLLRKLNLMGELMDSHILHIYMLVAPDLIGIGSVIPLAKSAPEILNRALRMKKTAGDLCAVIGGRHTHPIATTIGGFTHYPTSAKLEEITAQLAFIRPDIEATVELFASLEFPEFERATEYQALNSGDGYAMTGSEIASTEGGQWPVERYLQVTNEYQVTHSTAKFARHLRPAYMVGALARFNLNHRQLHPAAVEAAHKLGLEPICTNPYKITLAQLVELVHCYYSALDLLEELLEKGVREEAPVSPTRMSGEGVGAVEAPRGTLYHHYKIQGGRLTDANCIIPTAQNLGNIEADMRGLALTMRSHTQPEVTQALEMLVRAYDPCISCATHMVEVNYVDRE